MKKKVVLVTENVPKAGSELFTVTMESEHRVNQQIPQPNNYLGLDYAENIFVSLVESLGTTNLEKRADLRKELTEIEAQLDPKIDQWVEDVFNNSKAIFGIDNNDNEQAVIKAIRNEISNNILAPEIKQYILEKLPLSLSEMLANKILSSSSEIRGKFFAKLRWRLEHEKEIILTLDRIVSEMDINLYRQAIREEIFMREMHKFTTLLSQQDNERS